MNPTPSAGPNVPARLKWSASDFAVGANGREYMIQSENLDGAHGSRRHYALWKNPKSRNYGRDGGWKHVLGWEYRTTKTAARKDAERCENAFCRCPQLAARSPQD